jgi:hypothetical protein
MANLLTLGYPGISEAHYLHKQYSDGLSAHVPDTVIRFWHDYWQPWMLNITKSGLPLVRGVNIRSRQ